MSDIQENRGHESATCAFCRIIRREEDASIAFEDDLSPLLFGSQAPAIACSCPRSIDVPLADLPATLVGPSFQNAQRAVRPSPARGSAHRLAFCEG